MTDKFTPGPWIEIDDTSSDKAITSRARINNSKGTICKMEVFFTGTHGAEQLANLALIKAAPDLYEALKYARRMVNASECDISFIDAALAKAIQGDQQ